MTANLDFLTSVCVFVKFYNCENCFYHRKVETPPDWSTSRQIIPISVNQLIDLLLICLFLNFYASNGRYWSLNTPPPLSFHSQNISILVVLLFSWETRTNTRNYQDLGDVYYGTNPLSLIPNWNWKLFAEPISFQEFKLLIMRSLERNSP